ncbi:uncharacterized protein LOC126576723 [Anopheles aquasalis]|uniref:uncharacterized protein LOC126576723 n=1 Tax=Anopheles aquasalis TaxID=42839 RepID=UPI00215AA8A0|nr:uncharacterized protein LOC126576723 [Anopheles aquasalis]
MMKLLPVLLLLGVACLAHAQFYENYKLYELHVQDSDHVDELNYWHDQGKLDFWNHAAPNRSVTVMISPRDRRRFEQMLKEEDIGFKVMMENVQEMLDSEKAWRKEQERIRPTNGAIDFNHFWTLDEINAYLEKLSLAYPKLVTLVEAGRTSLNRPINAITISTKGRINQKRPVVLIDAGLQAREWASHMAVMHLIHQLVVNSEANQELLKNTDWVIVPVANPDGYAYSHDMNRLWRKNRSAGKTICPGADLSHNFPFRWHYTSNSCTEGYSGSAPASETETRALMLLMAQYARSLKMYLTVHACGEYILYPYGYDNVQVPNAPVLHFLGEQAARAAREVSGTVYQVGSAGSVLTPKTGSADFVYGSYGAEFTYTLELPCGRAGSAFLLETNRLAQVSAEAFEMFKVFGKFVGSTTVGRPYDASKVKDGKVKDTKAVGEQVDSSSADEESQENDDDRNSEEHARSRSHKTVAMKSLAVVCCWFLVAVTVAKAGSYHEFELYTVRPETQEQLMELRRGPAATDVDFWDAPKLNRESRMMAARADRKAVVTFLERHDIDYELVVEDVQELLTKEVRRNEEHLRRVRRDSNSRATIDFDHFWTLEEIYDYLDELAAAYTGLVRVSEVGTTHEGRPIKAITISTNGEIDQTRPIVFIDGGIHAREWAGVMSVMYMIHEFVEHSEQYPGQLTNADYVIIPVLNPDGYVYTHDQNRLWRKNRSQVNVLCYGVDLNRNFPYQWAKTTTACTNNYAGTAHGSEKETQTMLALMDRYKSAIRVYLAVHTYGELILWPWGYDFIHSDNAAELQRVGEQARDALVAAGGPSYLVGNSADILYTASGATDDYAHSLGVPYAYTLELTGGGLEGFDLPTSELPKVTADTFELFKVFGQHAGTLTVP